MIAVILSAKMLLNTLFFTEYTLNNYIVINFQNKNFNLSKQNL